MGGFDIAEKGWFSPDPKFTLILGRSCWVPDRPCHKEETRGENTRVQRAEWAPWTTFGQHLSQTGLDTLYVRFSPSILTRALWVRWSYPHVMDGYHTSAWNAPLPHHLVTFSCSFGITQSLPLRTFPWPPLLTPLPRALNSHCSLLLWPLLYAVCSSIVYFPSASTRPLEGGIWSYLSLWLSDLAPCLAYGLCLVIGCGMSWVNCLWEHSNGWSFCMGQVLLIPRPYHNSFYSRLFIKES